MRHIVPRLSQRLGLDRLSGEGWSVTYLTLMAALILMSYGLTRGPSEALFLRELSHTLLPGLWIEVGVGVVCVVAIYNYLLRFFSLKTMFSLSVITTYLSLLGIVYGEWGGESRVIELVGIEFPLGNLTLLRLWCDLYIVVFVETYWSMANRRFSLKKATYVYGLLCAGGTIGSVVSNSWVATRAHMPEDYILYSLYTLPALFALNVLLHRYWRAHPNERTRDTANESASESSSLGEGIRLIFKSRYLIWILALVLLAQITVALIDYEYKRALRDWYLVQPERAHLAELYGQINWSVLWGSIGNVGGASWGDLLALTDDALHKTSDFYRAVSANISGFQGWMYLSIDIGSLLCQLLTGWIILNLGIARTHLSIPMLLLMILMGAMVWPTILLIAAARSAAKFLTYSIFKSAKELLYVPLTYDEQTQGKAVIDIMVYRQAKILASILLLPAVGVVLLGVKNLAIIGLIIWVGVVLKLRGLIERVD